MSILQKSFAQCPLGREGRVAMKRSAISVGLIGAFVFAIALSVSPQLHERFHPDAKQSQHECAVTLVAHGNYHHAAPPPVLVASFSPNQFSEIATLNSVWVPSLFLGARIFEHAPPACA
jgi:hypothetical protein